MQISLCIRCGKERIAGKVWTEVVGQSLVTHTQTICPDSACQKIVEEEITARREKRELFMNKRIKANQTKLETDSSKAKQPGIKLKIRPLGTNPH